MPAKKAPSDSAATTARTLPEYTLAEVQKHNTPKDAWTTCGGYVHDITSFMDKHPGGADYLHEILGKDCEQLMQEHDHSSYSYSLLKSYVIGTVKGQEQRQHFEVEASHLRGYKAAELDGAVDFSKPTLSQIYALGDKYWPWLVCRPVCKDNALTIFSSKLLESLSHYPWWYIWVVWTPIMLLNIYYGLVSSAEGQSKNGGNGAVSILSGGAIKTVALSFFFGALTWTVTEYVLHRWVFHHEVFTPGGNVFHYFAHGIHHLIPTDSSRLTFPPLFGIGLGVLFFFMFRAVLGSAVFAAATSLVFGAVPASGAGPVARGLFSDNVYFAGFLFGYVMYDTMHYFFHHSDFNNRLFRKLKAAHMNHHYKNEFANFGVSSPLWDLVLGTWDAEAEAKHK